MLPGGTPLSRAYLDAAGSFPVLSEVEAALRDLPEGNPSSLHAEGRLARAALDRARDLAASALGVGAAELVFCASGTEAVNLALLGAGRRLPAAARIVTWAAEHQAVLGAVRRLELDVIVPRNAFATKPVQLRVNLYNPRLWMPAFSVKAFSPGMKPL